MSLIGEQINAIKYVGRFMDDLFYGPRPTKEFIKKRISYLMRHYPTSVELEMWRGWLLKGKKHE